MSRATRCSRLLLGLTVPSTPVQRSPWENPGMTPLIILGCGYVGTRLARTALAAGRTVRVCGRSTGRLAPITALGAQGKYVDAGVPKQLGPVLASLPGATVVHSVPPVTTLPPGQAIRAALQAA